MSMTTMQVAETILAQLGGRQFIAMTGARDLAGDDASLQFKIGSNAHKVTAVRIVLHASDTYFVTFYRGRGVNMRPCAEHGYVHAEDLRDLFERETGLYTSLSPRGPS